MSDTSTSTPETVSRRPVARQKVPPFARFKGTSAWRKDHRRARDYARYLAATSQAKQTPHA